MNDENPVLIPFFTIMPEMNGERSEAERPKSALHVESPLSHCQLMFSFSYLGPQQLEERADWVSPGWGVHPRPQDYLSKEEIIPVYLVLFSLN